MNGIRIGTSQRQIKRTYKPAVYLVLFYTICAAVVALIAASAVFEAAKNVIWAIAAFCAAFGLYLFFFIIPSLVTFELDDEKLILKTPGKKQVFPLASTFFSAESLKSGSYKECTLYIGRLDTVDTETGYIMQGQYIFCTLLGMPRFNALITDLGIKGIAMPKERVLLAAETDRSEEFWDNPNAIKVYIDYHVPFFKRIFRKIEVHSVDGLPPVFFKERGKRGFYLKRGCYRVESSVKIQRPGLLSLRVVTTYGPSIQIFDLEDAVSDTYTYAFDLKKRLYTLEIVETDV